ncbi:MAG: hypothetical protein SGJ18_08080 [Pseudomonadota bacterium]|nr:hypothetical protein [Pseudomonadota bacterium]
MRFDKLNFDWNRLFSLLFVLLFSGCTTLGIDSEEIKDAGPQTAVLEAPFDKVWRAAQLALAKYPIKVNNMDSAILETDYIKFEKLWRAPYQKTDPPSGERQLLSIRMIRGAYEDRNEAVKVIVTKIIELAPDFISQPKRKISDGIEERLILYRISRELAIEKALVKANEKETQEKSKN